MPLAEAQIYFFAVDGSILARNIHDSHHVSFTIDDYLSDWRKLRELQGVGRGYPIGNGDGPRVATLVAEKFGSDFATPAGRLYAVAPIEMHFVDYDEANVATTRGADSTGRIYRFDGAPAPAGAAIATRLDRTVFERGEVILRPGDRGVVVEGQVEVRSEGFGADQVVTRVGPGQMFGDRAALRAQPGALTAHALEHTVVLGVEREAVRDLATPTDG